jgi:hypothetical protein
VQTHGGGGRYSLILMGRDVLNQSQTSLLWRYGAGMEVGFLDKFFVRVGYMQNLSIGLGLKTKTFMFDFAWYNENVGDATTPVIDQQFRLQFRIGAF